MSIPVRMHYKGGFLLLVPVWFAKRFNNHSEDSLKYTRCQKIQLVSSVALHHIGIVLFAILVLLVETLLLQWPCHWYQQFNCALQVSVILSYCSAFSTLPQARMNRSATSVRWLR